MTDWRPSASWQTLQQRSAFFAHIRHYLSSRNCLEVQVPVLQDGANIDHGVAVYQTADQQYLCTSPEHYLKRLLCAGMNDCFAIHPCFRKDERGRKHQPSFFMLEWYRKSWDLDAIIQETCSIIQSCIGKREQQFYTYREAFLAFCQLDPFTASTEDLQKVSNCDLEQRGDLLDLCMVDIIEPSLPPEKLCILHEYPANQAAQARCDVDAYDNPIAKRFEVYAGGFELANGYHENPDAASIRQRMQLDNANNYDIDEAYLSVLDHGLQDCSGVALGLDRLFMLQHGLGHINDAVAFPV